MNNVTTITKSDRPVFPLERRPLRVYLAGKIVKYGGWRNELSLDKDRPFSFDDIDEALDLNASMYVHVNNEKIEVVGPFFVGANHTCTHDAQTHAVEIDLGATACRDEIQKQVHAVNLARIRRADFVFAHVDEVDCFGTLSEIGFAHGVGVPVYLHFGPSLTQEQRYDFWFVEKFAAAVTERITVAHAFSRAVETFRRERMRWLRDASA